MPTALITGMTCSVRELREAAFGAPGLDPVRMTVDANLARSRQGR